MDIKKIVRVALLEVGAVSDTKVIAEVAELVESKLHSHNNQMDTISLVKNALLSLDAVADTRYNTEIGAAEDSLNAVIAKLESI